MDFAGITPTNFIENIIVDDLKSGRVNNVVMRFPPEQIGRASCRERV